MVKLALTDFGGDGPAPRLVLLHGLLGTARNLAVVARAFTPTRHVVGFDMRNHGASDWAETNSYEDMAADVADALSHLDGPYDLLGHSMGGKTAMYGVLSGLFAPRKTVIGDIAPVTYDHTQAHTIEAMLALDLSDFDRRGTLATRLSNDLDDPMVGPFLAQSADLGETPRWRHNLPVLLSEMDKIIGFPPVSARYDGPVLVVAGGASHYVEAGKVHQFFPNADVCTIDGAGHWVHAEAPKAFNTLVAEFLAG